MGFNSYCVETDGLTQYAKMGDVLDLEFGDGPLAFSIMVWFKTTDTGGYLVSKMDNTPTEPDLSNVVDYRLPPLLGPYAHTWATLDAGGVDNHVDVLVADDGSFCMTTRRFPTSGGGIGYPRTFLFFNIMDDVPSQDPYGFFLFAVGNESKVLDQEKTTWKNGVGLDPDGVASNRSMLRSVPYDTNGTMTSVRSPATFIAEDPAWGKYYSEKIPIFCATAGRRGIRGTLSDIWWAPFNVTTGVCGHIDTSTKVCCMQCFWLPCPGDPWIL